jgi:hypothetical protein
MIQAPSNIFSIMLHIYLIMISKLKIEIKSCLSKSCGTKAVRGDQLNCFRILKTLSTNLSHKVFNNNKKTTLQPLMTCSFDYVIKSLDWQHDSYYNYTQHDEFQQNAIQNDDTQHYGFSHSVHST